MSIPANSERALSQSDSIGWINRRWLPYHEIALPISDLGIRQAVTVVERLRTYHGSVFGMPRHLRRLAETTSGIGIEMLPSDNDWSAMIADLLGKNASLLNQDGDLGITLLVTPGEGSDPTIVMHVNRIDQDSMKRRQTEGQPIVITDVVQPPAESWPRQWKVRCRLHYYLADLAAKKRHQDATGLLRDSDGAVTESSIANIAIVESGRIFSPRKSQVLAGITQSYVQQLADEANLSWTFESLTAQRVARADEILLMGTDTGIWSGWNLGPGFVDGNESSAAHSPGPVFSQLRAAFDRLVSA